jgi:hypothetical protein
VRVPDSHLPKGLSAASATSSKAAAIPPIIQKVVISVLLTSSARGNEFADFIFEASWKAPMCLNVNGPVWPFRM